MTLTGCSKEHTTSTKLNSISSTKCGNCYRERDDPGEWSQNHSGPVQGYYRGGVELLGWEDGEVADVDKEVTDSDEGKGDDDGTGEVCHWILQFFNDKVESTPAIVGVETGEAGQSN